VSYGKKQIKFQAGKQISLVRNQGLYPIFSWRCQQHHLCFFNGFTKNIYIKTKSAKVRK